MNWWARRRARAAGRAAVWRRALALEGCGGIGKIGARFGKARGWRGWREGGERVAMIECRLWEFPSLSFRACGWWQPKKGTRQRCIPRSAEQTTVATFLPRSLRATQSAPPHRPSYDDHPHPSTAAPSDPFDARVIHRGRARGSSHARIPFPAVVIPRMALERSLPRRPGSCARHRVPRV